MGAIGLERLRGLSVPMAPFALKRFLALCVLCASVVNLDYIGGLRFAYPPYGFGAVNNASPTGC
jgi:hypothetical protein